MPSMELYERMVGKLGKTVGQAAKTHSDMIMETTWDNDIESRVCYIYDYYHDDQPDLSEGMTYKRDTPKYKISCKFIVTQHGLISQNQVEYHIMFKPSQPVTFEEGDKFYYYETNYRQKYGMNMVFPIGQYIDIPDDRNVYHRWLIVSKEIGNQFIKYSVLPCDYRYQWISQEGSVRKKNKMWGVTRQQATISSRMSTNEYFDNVKSTEGAILPLNDITEAIHYIGGVEGEKENTRMILGAPIKYPSVGRVSEIKSNHPLGLLWVTFDKDKFNPNTDYVNLQTKEMFADYNISKIEPIENIPQSEMKCILSASTNTIKVGGSYRTITAVIADDNGNELKDKYDAIVWSCFIDGVEFSNDVHITWHETSEKNKIKIKFSNDKSYLGNVLVVKCSVDDVIGEIQLELVN